MLIIVPGAALWLVSLSLTLVAGGIRHRNGEACDAA
jgi:hypothetical protein